MTRTQTLRLLFASVSLLAAAGAQAQAPAPAGDEPIVAGPIIADSAFDEALPPLDPELSQPLEPIDGTGPPAPDGAVPLAELPADPIDNPELAAPLPPIATFDVTPAPAAPATEEAPAVRYTVRVEGLDAIDLEGRFRDLSALDDGDGEATNGAQIAARAREDEALAVRLMRSEGYYDGAATSVVEPAQGESGRVNVIVTATPGERYMLGEIVLIGPETVPPGLALDALQLKTGEPIVAARIEGAEANVQLRLPEQGYPFVTIGQRDIILDPQTGAGDYTLPVDAGPRASFRNILTEGNLAFDADHVAILSRFDRGEIYDRRMVDDLREAMVATSLFSSVTAEPVRTGETGPDATEYVDVLVRQEAGPPRALAASLGYSTGEGIKLEGSWEHRNLFPPEGALRIAGVAGTQEQSASVRFRRSNAGMRDRSFTIEAEAGRRDYAAFEGYTARVSAIISRDSTPIWQKRWTWAYGAEIIATNENRFDLVRFERDRETYFIGGLIGQLGHDTSDNLLNPTRGFRLLGRVNPEASLRDGVDPYLRSLVEGSYYYPATDALVIAGRVRLGSIFGVERDALAPSRRFYAGGGGSVRGFGYQELGPRTIEPNPDFDPDNPDDQPPTISLPIGGRSLNEFALEGRYRFGDYGIVAFVDAGQVYDSELPEFSDLRFGVGVGARLYTNFGPLRVDVATPIARQPGESIVSVYISIGQAF